MWGAGHEARSRGRSPAQIRALACARGDKELQAVAEDAIAGKEIPAPAPKPALDPKAETREFTITTATGDQIRIEYRPDFRHHMAYHGPISDTGYKSDFTFTGEGDPEAYATKLADAWQAELAKEANKGRGKKAPAAPAPSGAKTAPAKPKDAGEKKERHSALTIAADLLRKAASPMTTGEMMDAMLAQGLWQTGGKTPAATLYSAIIREIANKGAEARFKKVERGKFIANT